MSSVDVYIYFRPANNTSDNMLRVLLVHTILIIFSSLPKACIGKKMTGLFVTPKANNRSKMHGFDFCCYNKIFFQAKVCYLPSQWTKEK